MTAELLIICVTVWLGCRLQSTSRHEPFEQVQRAWSAILDRDFSDTHDGVRRMKTTELHGPFDVWTGEWWRIPATVFHHRDLGSLVLSLGATWYLGARLERRWGSLRFAVFLVPAICLPVMVELCLGHASMGLSGLACAMLGALVILRRFDAEVAKDFTEDASEIGIALIFMGWVASLGGVVSLPNAGNLSGFAYGAAIAGISSGPLRNVMLVRVSLILAHLWLVPALFLACHPFWIGRYYWHQAVTTKNHYLAERSLERAVHWDPSLIGAWLQWARLSEEQGDQSEAWQRLINGLSENPASAPLIDGTRRLWRHLDLRERRDAQLFLQAIFGRRMAKEWLNQIRIGMTPVPENPEEAEMKENPAEDAGQFSLDQKVELPAINNPRERLNPENHKIQIEQNDAVEGETL